MFLASAVSQTEDALDGVLRTIREEYEGPYSVLCETDRERYVEEEKSLRVQLKEIKELESNCNSWRPFLSIKLSSPQASKCLKDAQELLQRVKEDINSKVRTRLTGRSILPSGEQGSLKTSEQDAGLQSAEVTSLLNIHGSVFESGAPEANVDSDVNSVQNVSSESSDGVRGSSSLRHRRSPPPPPLRQIALSNNLLQVSSDSDSDSSRSSHSIRRAAPPPPQLSSGSPRLSVVSSGTGDDSPCRSPSIRRPAPPPPQSSHDLSRLSVISSDSSNDSPRRSSSIRRSAPPPPRSPSGSGPLSETASDLRSSAPRRSLSARRPAPSPPQSPRQSRASPVITSFLSPSPGSPPLDPATISSLSMLTQQLGTLASSMATDSSGLAQGRQKSRRNDYVVKSNCLDISGSNIDGVTMNNGSSNCSGAVIHKTVMPPRQQVPPF